MLHFFRKMRKILIPENRFGRYFFYAVGEIVLVVIGILIALNINNWNTNNQETKELQNHLKNIQNNLQADIFSIEEVRTFRDSSGIFSQNYLRIAQKDIITIVDFNSIQNSKYKVYFDNYFKAHKSGFETLKNSGFWGKLSGTSLEMNINKYYYLVEKINEREESLNNTIENLEIVAFTNNYNFRMSKILNNAKNEEAYFSTHQKEIKELLNYPSMMSANFRNRNNLKLFRIYIEMEELANEIISEINNTIINHN